MDSTLNQLLVLGFQPNKIRCALQSMDRGHNYDIIKIITQINAQRTHKALRTTHNHKCNATLCPLCHHIAFTLAFCCKDYAFCCAKCCNQRMQHKRSEIDRKQNDIRRMIAYIQQIISNKPRHDIKLQIRESQNRVSSLKQSIQETQQYNHTLKQRMNELHKRNHDRLRRIEQLKSEYGLKWRSVLKLVMRHNVKKESEYTAMKELCCSQSRSNVLQLFEYFVMNTNQYEQRAMIQNIVVPLQFTIANINTFYRKCDSFRYPISECRHPSPQLRHCIHMEHGICAALYHIVSFLKHAFGYLSIDMLHPMHLSRTKGAYIKDNMDYRLSCSNFTDADVYNDFEYALSLLHRNVTFLCTQYGINQHKLKYCAFIHNLMILKTCLLDKQRSEKCKRRISAHVGKINFTSYHQTESDESDEWEKI